MSIYDILLVLIGAALCQLMHELKKCVEQERAHAAWVREWQWQHRPRTWGVVRTRHRRAERYTSSDPFGATFPTSSVSPSGCHLPRKAGKANRGRLAPRPLPLDDMAAQLEKCGKARLKIGRR